MELIYVILAAGGLGALHSLEPGHGKGMISAYLVSSHARVKDAVFLGVTTALAHSLSIMILALMASSAARLFLPGNVIYWIQLISGVVISVLGTRILYQRIRPQVVVMEKVGAGPAEMSEHHHGLFHHHVHANETPSSLPRLFALGFFIGLIPCPSALAVLLAAVGAHQISEGLTFVFAFSVGSAVTMSTIGMLVVLAGDSVKRPQNWRVVDAMTLISSIMILALGLFVIYQGLEGLG